MLIAFVGKGGVGKTTVSSACALELSRHGKTAVISSDFMSSLRHVFPVDPPGLSVMEISEVQVARDWTERYGKEVELVLKQFFKVEPWIIEHIAQSPGVAEEFVIAKIVELEESGEFDFVVWDTAASSSTMHLLMLEKEFYEHLDRDVRLFLSVRDRFHTEKVLNLLEGWKELAAKVWKKLQETAFYLITTNDELSLIQSGEILNDFRGMGLKIAGKICNRCEQATGDSYTLKIPQFRGSARGIVEEIAGSLDPEFTRGILELPK